MIVITVDEDLHGVVVPQLVVPLGHVGRDPFRPAVVAADAEIQVLGIIENDHRGRFRGR